MSEDVEINVGSGVSWLLEALQIKAKERMEYLKEGIAEGVPQSEYEQLVGRYRESKRWYTFMVSDTFAEFQQMEEASLDNDELEEMPADE